MIMTKDQIEKVLTHYYYMIDEYYSDTSSYKVDIEQIEKRCEYFEGVLKWLSVNDGHKIEVEVDKIYLGGI